MNLREIEQARERATTAEELTAVRAALQRLTEECRLIKLDVTIALERPYQDLRPAMLVYVHDMARVYGRTPAQQVRAFMRDRDPWFQKLALAAWGISFDA